ncbi:MAG TPA: class I poly(R)-hydroxyalkanoic acid synthase [Methylibium sp.]|uniref:PHA/PHB synthase family protein n=1 Tax=Methylibium sp. TaxID=2067992 RepID=UPI002DB7C35A|nr:class I poly(R)-hydroxyalkanoic acid synthase [Methylibium sp.]HEU4460605.1 class I poly(R)-hydroxyalkanoic acid synthase [Methylibium sp.]
MKPSANALGADPAAALQQFTRMWTEWIKEPRGVELAAAGLPQLQSDYLREATALWNRLARCGDEGQGDDGTADRRPDRRFAGADWAANPAAAYTAGMYLLNARTLMQLADQVQADEKTRQRVRFAVQQWIDAASPSNYLALNPEAQRKALESKGESIALGMKQLWHDLQQGHVSQTDESVFEVGRNVATTEGAVVFENELFQLIQYKPLTAKVHERPLLIVPPCINKFYILDLQPENSLVRHALMQGQQVFMLSWVNATEAIGDRTWDHYVEDAVIRAIDEVRAISRQDRINTLGFCIGGTLLATALAVLAARGEKPSASLTLLTSFLDFSDTGVLDLFVDEDMVKLREMSLGQRGLLKGKELATTFSFLRPNDLVWNYVVGNYLKGETPPPFDLLYWNSDSTDLPGPMYCWYLRHTYLEDNLKVPGKVTVCGEKLDLRQVDAPTFIYASREDHIVPWHSAYLSTRILPGKKQFVLGASGHIAGVINPPEKKKRSHWTNAKLPPTAQAWFDGATEHPGSWWPAWIGWLAPHAGKLVPAPKTLGDRTHKPSEPAPGRYVKARA